MSKSQRDKGRRRELEVIRLHLDLGIKAERVPLSGASHYRGNGADIDIYPPGRDAPLVCEVKARASGEGFKTLEAWLGINDVLVLIRDRATPMVVLPWRTYSELICLRRDSQLQNILPPASNQQ